jgi:DNA repair protein RadC
MPITDWPLQERPREKLLHSGVANLSPAELLAIFLQTGLKGKTALDMARELLNQYKTLRNILSLNQNQMSQIPGIGKAKYSMLQAALELGRRVFQEDLEYLSGISSAGDAKNFVMAKLANFRQEVFACIFLNSRHRIIKYEQLFYGTIHCTPIYPRVIAQKALEYNASAVIFAHNHPSGDTKPSQSDLKSTQNLVTALSYLDIRVLDHLIVGGNQCISFIEEGLI